MMYKEKHRDGKDVLVVEYRKSSVFAGYHIFAMAGLIERYMEGAIFTFHERKQKSLSLDFGSCFVVYFQ